MSRAGERWMVAAALLVCLTCGLVLVFWLYPQSRELRAQIGALPPPKSAQPNTGAGQTLLSASAQLLEHTAGAAAPSRMPERLRAMYALAASNKLAVIGATYRQLPPDAAGIGRYEVQLEAQGPYFGARLFMRSLQAADKLAALQSADFRRDTLAPAESGLTRISLRLVFFQAGSTGKTP